MAMSSIMPWAIVNIEYQVRGDLTVSQNVLQTCIMSKLASSGLNNYSHLPSDFAQRTKSACIAKIFGPRNTWFFGMHPWKTAFTSADPMNVMRIEASESGNKYLRCFVAPGVCRRLAGELPHVGDNARGPPYLRPIIAPDCCFAKPPLSYGQIMILTVFDANDNIFPLVFAHVAVENFENWKWCLELFAESFPRFAATSIVCLADQDKGMGPAIANVFPHWFRRACARHLEPHVTAKGTKDVRGLFWQVAKAWKQPYAAEALQRLEDEFPECHKHVTNLSYVGADGKLKAGVTMDMWTNAWSTRTHWGKLASQGAECTNNAILPFRHLPVPFMIPELVKYVHDRVTELGQASLSAPLGKVVLGNVKKALDAAVTEGRELEVRTASLVGRVGEVESRSNPGTFHSVSLDDGMMCCGRWTTTHIPCRHQCRLAAYLRIHPSTLVGVELRADTARAMYGAGLPVLPVSTVGVHPSPGSLQPPDEPKPKGRPAKKRKSSMGEGGGGKVNRCSRCGQTGHNKVKCKAPLSSQQQQQGNDQ